jgi:alanyl-tRNA synthetase
MTASELRQKYLDFFKSKGHAIIPSASLIPENDPTALFTSAGMHPLVPYLLGERHPAGQRLANCQKCIRTTDIEEVGDAVHHTFLEMLGNWSLGDPDAPDGVGAGYFKKEAIEWSWEFLTSPDWLGLDKNKIAVSVFAGDEDAPFDKEAYDIWRNDIGVAEERIARLPKKDNWWGPAGETGPCGPDTEMFYWVGAEPTPKKFNPEDKRWVEIWNDVFMQFNKKPDGTYESLKQKNVDTGMGLERVLAVLNGLDDNYQTELFINVITKIEHLSDKKYGQSDEITWAMRIIADHLKAATFIIGDDKGITPSNLDQGYVVRRLIRRAIRYGRQLGITQKNWTKDIAEIVINDYEKVCSELKRNKQFILCELEKEESKFGKTLERGLKEFEKIVNSKQTTVNRINREEAFNLYQTYGFPVEMTKELAGDKGLTVDEDGFKEELKKHQELSRTASVGKFKGGLADASEETKKLHTAAHLLLAALRKVLGSHVVQKGSNITPQRLRFDFSHSEKMTEEQKQEVERLVNEAIAKDLPVHYEEMSLDEAKKKNAMGVFESKYGEKVKVYTVGEGDKVFSKEICGGPHVERTGALGQFKIKKEQSSSAGVRRIKAVLV